jgi:putative toxin-antitoxin system antitoxin component (TIGR02293 family)
MKEALKILGLTIPQSGSSADYYVFLIERGIPKSALDRAKRATGLTYAVLAQLLSVSAKTIERKKPTERFDDTASERLVKLGEIIALGREALGDDEALQQWLVRPLRPLGGKSPVDLMRNMYGLEMIKQLLGRIQYGVYS